MLLPVVEVEQKECNKLIFREVTPDYSPKYLGGYGCDNIDSELIMRAEITLDFGSNGMYMFSKLYNREMEPFVINAEDIVYQKSSSGCDDCGTPCGCENCNDAGISETDCRGNMTNFPEGCIKIKYEVYSLDDQGKYHSEGIKVFQIINACHQKQRVIDLFDKITGGRNGQYDFYMTKEKRFDVQTKVNIAWAKLQLSNFKEDCDCRCIDSRIKRIRADLDSIDL